MMVMGTVGAVETMMMAMTTAAVESTRSGHGISNAVSLVSPLGYSRHESSQRVRESNPCTSLERAVS
jgi:hypothetical protein